MSRREPSVARAPRVTVGMPVYNGAKWIGRSVESILDQTFGDLELVVSDNASVDESVEIAERYAEQDERVRIIRSPVNVGIGRNYSRLVGLARSEYFKWASANDLCDPRLIEKCVDVLDARPDVALCSSRAKLFVDNPETGRDYDVRVEALDEDPLVRFRSVLRDIRVNNAMNGLIRMSVLRRTGLIRPHYSSDITLLAEIALRAKLVELPEVLFFRRYDKDSATALQDQRALRRMHFPEPGPAMLFQTWRQCYGYVSAIRHSEMTLSQRVRGLMYVARTWWWAFPHLYADVKEAGAALAGRGPGSER